MSEVTCRLIPHSVPINGLIMIMSVNGTTTEQTTTYYIHSVCGYIIAD